MPVHASKGEARTGGSTGPDNPGRCSRAGCQPPELKAVRPLPYTVESRAALRNQRLVPTGFPAGSGSPEPTADTVRRVRATTP